jgi:hypothetical protein
MTVIAKGSNSALWHDLLQFLGGVRGEPYDRLGSLPRIGCCSGG